MLCSKYFFFLCRNRTNKIHVTNISVTINWDEIQKLFGSYGRIVHIEKGLCYCTVKKYWFYKCVMYLHLYYLFSIWITLLQNFFFFLFPSIYYVRECIVIVKKLDFQILTYLYVFRYPEFIYVIFTVMYACVCVCMWVNTIASKWPIRFSSNLVCILQLIIAQTLLILVNVGLTDFILLFIGL